MSPCIGRLLSQTHSHGDILIELQWGHSHGVPTDGIEDPFYPLEKQAAGIFRQFYKGVDQPLKDFKAQLPQAAPLLQESAAWGLAQWLEFEKRGENDDRTVAVLHRQPVNVSW